MAQLSNPNLSIELISGTSDAVCTATVDVGLTPFELFFINSGLVGLQLECNLWGADGGLNGGDDHLFNFAPQSAGTGGQLTFQTTVNRDVLDEDSWPSGNDEVYAHFNLASTEPSFPIHVEINTPEISGDF